MSRLAACGAEISLVSAKVEPRELLGLLVGPQEQAQGDTTAAPWLQPSWDNAPQSGTLLSAGCPQSATSTVCTPEGLAVRHAAHQQQQ